MKYIYILGVVFALFACKKVDTVKGDESIAVEGSVVAFNYEDVEGVFKGQFNGKEVILDLQKTKYQLQSGNNRYEGDYAHINDGGTIELMDNPTLPFSYLRIEDKTFLVILDENGSETEYYLEQ